MVHVGLEFNAAIHVNVGIIMNVESSEPALKTLHFISYIIRILNLKRKRAFCIDVDDSQVPLYQAGILNYHELLQGVKAAVLFKRAHPSSEDIR